MKASLSNRSSTTLASDQRGAVMLMGIFMACVLVGTLWSLIGVGNALVFRDRMQETADSVVFSAASVHARGMNFIAAMNLIMLAIVAVHMAMGILHYTLQLIAGALEACSATLVGAPVCAGPAVEVQEAAESVRNTWVSYMSGAKPVLVTGAAIESATSLLAPWGGELAAMDVAKRYGQTGFAISPSMFPTVVPTFSPGKAPSGGSAANEGAVNVEKADTTDVSPKGTFGLLPGKLGLPVSENKMQMLCKHAAQAVIFWVKDQIKKIPIVGTVIDLPGVKSVINFGIDFGGDTVMTLLCNESGGAGVPLPSVDIFWKGFFVGPKTIWSQAHNGNDWLQVWAFVTDAKYSERAESKVAVAGNQEALLLGKDPEIPTFNAQAEFYYDCKSDWSSCNQNDTPAFSMRWKVRLRRFRKPNLQAMLLGLGAEVIFSNGVVDALRGKVKNTKPFQKIEEKISSFNGLKKWLGGKGLDALTRDQNAASSPNKIASKIRGKLGAGNTPSEDEAFH